MCCRDNNGFTLIEIVMVLVLIGILSAVAVPKYYDLTEQARIREAQSILSDSLAELNHQFAARLLSGMSCEEAIAVATYDPVKMTGVRYDAPAFYAGNGEATLFVKFDAAGKSTEGGVYNASKWGDWSYSIRVGEVSIPTCSGS